MSDAAPPRSGFRETWLVPLLLLGLALVPALAGITRLVQLTDPANRTEENARFFGDPFTTTVHIVAVILYSFVGAFQFSRGFRRRARWWHRASGKIIAPVGIVAALSGLWMAHYFPWPPADGRIVYAERLLVGVAMTWCLVQGLLAVRRREYHRHGDWMIRAYALGLGAGTQVFTHLPWFVLVDLHPMGYPRAFMMGMGWLINAVVAEWIVRRRRGAQGQRTFEPVMA